MSVYTNPRGPAEARLALAAFNVGQAQRALEDAQAEFTAALNAVDWLKDRERENRVKPSSISSNKLGSENG